MEIQYKGFTARICYSGYVGLFYGEILNMQHLIHFQASTVKKAEENMRAIIDIWLDEQEYNPSCLVHELTALDKSE